MPKITVIVTAYQDRGWIDDALESAYNQTFKDYDIIFCSDGNYELKNCADFWEIPFICVPHVNYAYAINNAVVRAKGEWIKILHDDDLLEPDCLENLYNNRGDADLVYGNALCFNDDDFDSKVQYKPPSDVTIKNLLPIITNPVNFEAELFKRDMFIDIGGFDANLGYTEDYDFLLTLLKKGYKIKYLDKDVVWYRHHKRQITGNEPAMREAEQKYLINKHLDLVVGNITW